MATPKKQRLRQLTTFESKDPACNRFQTQALAGLNPILAALNPILGETLLSFLNEPPVGAAPTEFESVVVKAAGTNAAAVLGVIPTSSTSYGETGDVCRDDGAIYVCVAPSRWLKFTGSTF